MSYDFEVSPDRIPSKAVIRVEGTSRVKLKPTRINDLEAIVLLLELAAMSLSDKPSPFTTAQLYTEACTIAGNDAALDIEDVQIIVDKATFLKRERKNVFTLR